ncbi:MAG: prepilin-type N-terminal cleavage/methylation domain-containing protein, partial [Syntrophales bacterium]|nr:prepilin-type N-terminal cleavage/methylation domain-containing protein [Syntrophales bacterium]
MDAGPRGFSLVEMLIAMAVGLVVLGAMYSVFTIQNKTFGNQEEIVAMQQSVRAGMDMMAREIGMAGYDPTRVNSDSNPSNNFSGVTVNASQLQIQADLDGSGAVDATSQENIVYAFDATNKQITRNIGAGAQSFVENVETFTFAYLDSSGNVTAASASVRQIRITSTGRTAKPDPSYSANGGYRTYMLTSVIAPRNLAF